MCGSIFLGIFFGALAVKAMRRWSHFHGGGCGAGGGHGCGGRGRRFMYYRWSNGGHGGPGWGGRAGGEGS